jgi:hypothetical protein
MPNSSCDGKVNGLVFLKELLALLLRWILVLLILQPSRWERDVTLKRRLTARRYIPEDITLHRRAVTTSDFDNCIDIRVLHEP